MTFETHNILGFGHQLEFPAVAQAMPERSYEDETVRKLIGENWLRVFSQVWDRKRGTVV